MAKRSKPIQIGQTSIFKRNDTWWIRWSTGSYAAGNYTDHRHSLKVTIRELAEEKAREFDQLLARNQGNTILTLIANKDRTLAELIAEYLSTKAADKRYLKLLLDHLGQRPAASIAPHDLATFFNDHLGHLAPSSHNRYLAATSNLFKFGAEMLWFPDNPLRVKPQRVPKRQPKWFDEDEIEAIFTELPPWTRLIWTILLLTGLRGQALWSMRWEDIRWKKKQIHLVDTKAGHEAILPVLDDTLSIFDSLRGGISYYREAQPGRPPGQFMAITADQLKGLPDEYTKADLMECLDIPNGTYRRYVNQGYFPPLEPGGLSRFVQDLDVLRDYIERGQAAIARATSRPAYRVAGNPKGLSGYDMHTQAYHIAPQKSGEPIFHKIDLRSGLELAGQRAGVSDVHTHRLRHTFASRHLSAGTSNEALQVLGQWSGQEMIKIYAEFIDDSIPREGLEGLAATSRQDVDRLAQQLVSGILPGSSSF
jgi:integrase